jgi:heptaprenyl diphosphate synthase
MGGTALLVRVAALVAMGAVLGLVETTLVGSVPFPGVRLGLANLAVVVALVSLGPRAALAVSVARVLVVGVAAGTLGGPGFALSFVGAIAAWAAMTTLLRSGIAFSAIGLSVGGATAHVLAQLAGASFLVGTTAPLGLAPISLTAAALFGVVVGVLATLVLDRVPSLAPAGAGLGGVGARGAEAPR